MIVTNIRLERHERWAREQFILVQSTFAANYKFIQIFFAEAKLKFAILLFLIFSFVYNR